MVQIIDEVNTDQPRCQSMSEAEESCIAETNGLEADDAHSTGVTSDDDKQDMKGMMSEAEKGGCISENNDVDADDAQERGGCISETNDVDADDAHATGVNSDADKQDIKEMNDDTNDAHATCITSNSDKQDIKEMDDSQSNSEANDDEASGAHDTGATLDDNKQK